MPFRILTSEMTCEGIRFVGEIASGKAVICEISKKTLREYCSLDPAILDIDYFEAFQGVTAMAKEVAAIKWHSGIHTPQITLNDLHALTPKELPSDNALPSKLSRLAFCLHMTI